MKNPLEIVQPVSKWAVVRVYELTDGVLSWQVKIVVELERIERKKLLTSCREKSPSSPSAEGRWGMNPYH
jgi:hypothetical protein